MKFILDDLYAWGLLTLGVLLIAVEGLNPEPRWWLYVINACTIFFAARTLQIRAETRQLQHCLVMIDGIRK